MTQPLAKDVLWWSDAAGNEHVSWIVKATFALEDGRAQLVSPLALARDEPRTQPLWQPNDYVPYKPLADVIVVGTAGSDRPAARLAVGFAITRGPERLCARTLLVEQGSEPLRQARLPGCDERVMSSRGPRPEAFGPIRVVEAGAVGEAGAVAEDADLRMFQCAPDEQRIEHLAGGERICLTGWLHASSLSSHLPGLTVEAVAHLGGLRRPLSMAADTLWIDADRRLATVTWRGVLPAPAEARREEARLHVDLVPSPRAGHPPPRAGHSPAGASSPPGASSPARASSAPRRAAIPIDNRSGLSAACFGWQLRPGEHRQALVIKGTFDIVPGEAARLADEQAPLSGDRHRGDEPAASLEHPSDFAPFKPRADVILVGSAYPPPGYPVARVALRLGSIDKTIVAVGDRSFAADGSLSSAEPFESMPLVYERAFGGPDIAENPVGVGANGRTPPNLELPDQLLEKRGDRRRPACFGPIAPSWAPRAPARGIFDAAWQRTHWPVLPADFDFAHFNCAPLDQRIDGLRGDEDFWVSCVLPGGEALDGKLPGARPRAVVSRAPDTGEAQLDVLAPTLDTVRIDTDARQLQLVWRASFSVADVAASDVTRVLVVLEDGTDRWEREQLVAAALLAPEAHAAPSAPFTVAQLRAQLARAPAAISSPPPPPLDPPPPPSRAEIERLLAGGASLAGMDFTAADLSGLDFGDRDLTGAVLRDARLTEARCDGATFTGAVLAGADARRASFAGADLTRADVSGARLDFASFAQARLEQASFASASLDDGTLTEAHARRADFTGASLRRADLTRADLEKADLSSAILDQATLAEAELGDAKLYDAAGSGVILDGARLLDARLEAARLPGASVREARASGSVWERADISGSSLKGADLKGAVLTEARLAEAVLDGVDARGAVFRAADLRAASAVGADFMHGDFEAADLRDADLRGANLYQAELSRARLGGTQLDRALLAGTKLA